MNTVYEHLLARACHIQIIHLSWCFHSSFHDTTSVYCTQSALGVANKSANSMFAEGWQQVCTTGETLEGACKACKRKSSRNIVIVSGRSGIITGDTRRKCGTSEVFVSHPIVCFRSCVQFMLWLSGCSCLLSLSLGCRCAVLEVCPSGPWGSWEGEPMSAPWCPMVKLLAGTPAGDRTDPSPPTWQVRNISGQMWAENAGDLWRSKHCYWHVQRFYWSGDQSHNHWLYLTV